MMWWSETPRKGCALHQTLFAGNPSGRQHVIGFILRFDKAPPTYATVENHSTACESDRAARSVVGAAYVRRA